MDYELTWIKIFNNYNILIINDIIILYKPQKLFHPCHRPKTYLILTYMRKFCNKKCFSNSTPLESLVTDKSHLIKPKRAS